MARPPLAFCSISALDRSLEAVAALAAGQGLDGIEVSARPPHSMVLRLISAPSSGGTWPVRSTMSSCG